MFISAKLLIFASAVGLLSLVHSTPIKLSKPQAVTAANLTEAQIQHLIRKHPTRASILRQKDQFPSIPLYLPDPERNKSKDDFHLLVNVPKSEQSVDNSPIKLTIPLDSYANAPPLSTFDSDPFAHQVQQAKKNRSTYSYNNRYDYYFPVRVVLDKNHKYADKELQLMEMKPPVLGDGADSEPNYYAVKPKKTPKKFQPNKKEVNHSQSNDREEKLVPIDNDGLVLDDERFAFVTSQPFEHFAPTPLLRQYTNFDLNTGEYFPEIKEQKTEAITVAESTVPTILAAGSERITHRRPLHSGESNSNRKIDSIGGDQKIVPGKRVEFQMHGFKGPNSYRFGFDTGAGKGRQFRIEQREEDGSVKGEYGYFDRRGEMHLTKYTASAAEGFKSEQVPTT